MKKIKENTICSVSTKQGEGAIAVIRISGPKAKSICGKIFTSKHFQIKGDLKSNIVYYGKIKDGKKILDEVLLTYFQKPKSNFFIRCTSQIFDS